MSKSGWVKTIGPILVFVFAIIVTIILISAKKPPEEKPVETKDFLVEARPVSRVSTVFTIQSQGNVLPKNQTKVSAQVSGRVMRIADVFVVGGMFKKGDVLAVLEQADYETELKLAEAELAQAKANLEEEIARGKVAEKEWRSVNSVVPPELGLRKPQLAREQANLKAAEAKYDRASRNLARTEIRAPYNGIVINRNIDLGQFVPVGSEIGNLYSTDVAEVRLPITESELAFIDLQSDLRNTTEVTLRARTAGKYHQWQATLVRTEGVLDTGSRVMYAVAQVNDPYVRRGDSTHSLLRFGEFVEADIRGNEEESLFVLPRSALRLDNTVLTVTKDSTLHINEVDIARTTAKEVFIRDGLNENDKVIFSVVPNPYEGMKLRVSGEELKLEEEKPDAAAINVSGEDNE